MDSMSLLSIIVPARNERYLDSTINDILVKAKGDIEVIAVLDGYWSPIIEDERVHYIHFSDSRGMRNAINCGVSIAKGEYILKSDAHCMFDEGFDEILKTDLKDNWVAVPTRKRLDPENWVLTKTHKADINYMYLAHPEDESVWGGKGLQGKEWVDKNNDVSLKSELIVDLMTFQGSVWMMKKDYFHTLELMDESNYGEFAKESQEIGLKCWLSGGRVIRNKKTWYAHWHKPKSYGRGYSLSKSEWEKGTSFTNNWMTFGKAWDKQTLPIEYLIKKFNPPGWK